jgi:DNA-binding PadR family transcriptional regulator
MARKITNLIREGLPSKIYLLAYNEPVSGYEIAQKIQGLKSGTVPQTGKIYGWLKQLKTADFLEETKDGYQSKVEPLLYEINQVLSERQIPLTELESYIVSKILNDEIFRKLVEFSHYYKKEYFKREIDAAHEIMEVLGFQALLSSVYDVPSPNYADQLEFDPLWDAYSRDYSEEEIEASPELKAKATAFNDEEAYFKKTGAFKKGGIYEQLERQGRLVREGKKIKDWSFPLPMSIIPQELKDKLCTLSATYDLFQKVSTGRNIKLFTLFLEKKAKEQDLKKTNL